jgi:aminopeptidase
VEAKRPVDVSRIPGTNARFAPESADATAARFSPVVTDRRAGLRKRRFVFWSGVLQNYDASSTSTHMTTHDQRLATYAELAIKIGINLQPGQRLLIIGPLANGGASLDAAPFLRHIVASAYQAGARYVETLWGDESAMLVRFKHAPRDSFGECSAWLPEVLVRHVDAGHAVLSVYANDPDLLKGEPIDLVGAVQQAVSRSVVPFRERISRNQTNWAVVAAAAPAWAARVFPGLASDQGVARLWDAIVKMCRLDAADPLAAWEAHLQTLADRRDHLNHKQYTALRYRGPGTDLLLGLPAGHVWVSGRTNSQSGIPFTANLPTEEVFTMAHKDRVDGTVRATKPLSYGGTLIEDFSIRFAAGRVVGFAATHGESVLRQLVNTDEGAARLGEVALVPHSSPISQSGLLFYNTLFDENAASHVALGSAYRFTLKDGESMSDDAFAQAGGNRSATHVDFMIGSGELDVDGVLADGSLEPVMRAGEWAIGRMTR